MSSSKVINLTKLWQKWTCRRADQRSLLWGDQLPQPIAVLWQGTWWNSCDDGKIKFYCQVNASYLLQKTTPVYAIGLTGGGYIYFRSSKQPLVFTSSTHAEMRAIYTLVKDLLFLIYLCYELRVELHPTCPDFWRQLCGCHSHHGGECICIPSATILSQPPARSRRGSSSRRRSPRLW